jgi:hypothetical protein
MHNKQDPSRSRGISILFSSISVLWKVAASDSNIYNYAYDMLRYGL